MTQQAEKHHQSSIRELFVDSRFVTVLLVASTGTLGWNVISPTLPAMANAFGVTNSQIALVMTVYTLPAILFVPITGMLSDVYGRRIVVIPSLVLFGISGVGIGFVSTFGLVLALRAAQGIAIAGIMPLSVVMIGDLYGGTAGSTAHGMRVTTNGVGNVVFPALAGLLAAITWTYPFFLYGLSLVVAVQFFFRFPETIGSNTQDVAFRTKVASYGREMADILHNRTVFTLISGGFARDFARFGLITFMSLFAVQEYDAGLFIAGLLLSAYNGVRVVVSPLAGHVAESVSHRTAYLGSLACQVLGFALIPFSPSLTVLTALVMLTGAGDALFAPILKNAVTLVAGDDKRAGVVNAMEVFKKIAQTTAPVFFGALLIVATYRELFIIAGAVLLLYALTCRTFLNFEKVFSGPPESM